MEIIERILTVAENKKIKQADIAKALGKGTSLITNWKNRGTTPPAEELLKISEFLDVSIEFLITGTEREPGTALREDKQQLLDYYDAANPEGQNRIREQAKLLSREHPSNLTISGEETG